MNQDELMTPPTEIETSRLLAGVEVVPVLEQIVRRLLFQRDMLKAEQDALCEEYDSARRLLAKFAAAVFVADPRFPFAVTSLCREAAEWFQEKPERREWK